LPDADTHRHRAAVIIQIKYQIKLLFNRKELKEPKDNPFLWRLFFLCDLCTANGLNLRFLR
jgi:hypothetical protein